MIGFLRGRISAKLPPQLVLDVQGVGYEIDAPMTTFYDLPEVGQDITLFTHLSISENAHTLFGFAKLSDRNLFRELIKINGVGPRLALAILSGMSADEFVLCVQDGDSNALTKVPGIGKKTAERLVVELRDKLEKWGSTATASTSQTSPGKPAIMESATPVEEAVSALIALGYKPPEASRMVRNIDTHGLMSEEIIRQALQGAAKQ